jgi:hypothetical protein
MNAHRKDYESIHPLVSPRKCGGWLAKSPNGATLCIGVTANSETEAREKFLRSLDRCAEILLADGNLAQGIIPLRASL